MREFWVNFGRHAVLVLLSSRIHWAGWCYPARWSANQIARKQGRMNSHKIMCYTDCIIESDCGKAGLYQLPCTNSLYKNNWENLYTKGLVRTSLTLLLQRHSSPICLVRGTAVTSWWNRWMDMNRVATSVNTSYVKFFCWTCLLCKDVFWLCSLFACFHYCTARNALEVLVCLLLQR